MKFPEKYKIGTSKFWKMQNRHIKTRKNTQSAPQYLKFDFQFSDPKFDFENFKIDFSNSIRISIRDHQIWNLRLRKPWNLDFRFKVPIFLWPKSWFCIRYHNFPVTITDLAWDETYFYAANDKVYVNAETTTTNSLRQYLSVQLVKIGTEAAVPQTVDELQTFWSPQTDGEAGTTDLQFSVEQKSQKEILRVLREMLFFFTRNLA